MLDRFEHFITNITQIDLYWHRVAALAMSEYELKGNYAIYFTKLIKCNEGMTAAEMSATTGKDKADVSRDMGVLIKKGLVQKSSKNDNTYRAKLSLTPEGIELAKKIADKVSQAVNFVGLNEKHDDRESFYKMFDEITAKLEKLSTSDFK